MSFCFILNDRSFSAVMNYRYAENLKKITCEEFLPLFNEQQQSQNLKWNDVQVRKRFSMLFKRISWTFFLGKYFLDASTSLRTGYFEESTVWNGALFSFTSYLCSGFDVRWKRSTVSLRNEFYAGYWTCLFVLSDIYRWYFHDIISWWIKSSCHWYFIEIRKREKKWSQNLIKSNCAPSSRFRNHT